MARERVNRIDRAVGQRVRLLRLQQEMSQSHLASQLGITFQQIQKYEAGTNRISASKLFVIAEVFGVEVQALFADAGDKDSPAADQPPPAKVDLQLLATLARIPDGKVKRGILDLVAALAEPGEMIPLK